MKNLEEQKNLLKQQNKILEEAFQPSWKKKVFKNTDSKEEIERKAKLYDESNKND